MPTAIIPRESYEGMLLAMITGADWWVHLYTNDPPVNGDLTSAALVEPVYAGYGPQALSRWTPPTLRGDTAFSQADIVEWRWTAGPAPSPIRGYFVTHGQMGKLAWIRRRPDDTFPLGPGSPLLLLYLRLDFPPA